MKIKVDCDDVEFIDEKGNRIVITIQQLLELLRVCSIVFSEEGLSVFSKLEFTV